MFENIKNIFKRSKRRELLKSSSKDTAKERLHLVLMQDRANVSADFLDLMRQEIIEVIKKYIDIDEEAMDVRLATETNEDGTQGAPALYANIPIINIKDETRKMSKTNQENHMEPNIIKSEEEPKTKEEKEEKVSKTESNKDEKSNEVQNTEETKKSEKDKSENKEKKQESKQENKESTEKENEVLSNEEEDKKEIKEEKKEDEK